MKRAKDMVLDAYAHAVQRVFSLPGPAINLITGTFLTVTRPFLKERNFWPRMEEALSRTSKKNHPYVELVHHIADCNWNFMRAFAVSFMINRLVFGVSKTWTNLGRERRLEREGIWWPAVIAISITSRCNLECTGCYANGRFPQADLEYDVIERIVSEGESMGTFMYNMVGGEPMLRAEELWKLFGDHPNSCFVIFTNGTMLDEHAAEQAATVGNVVISVSIDGFEATNDARRGNGTFQKAIAAMDHLNAVRAPIAAYVTISKKNFTEVVSDRFVKMLLEHGVMELTLGEYVPTDGHPEPEWELDPWQRAFLLDFWEDHLRETYPLWVRHGRSAVPEVEVCDAARRHLHITPTGDVEPCLFCPVSVDNIHSASIREVMNSRFFQCVRALNEPNGSDRAATLKPCMMFRDPEVARQVEALAGS